MWYQIAKEIEKFEPLISLEKYLQKKKNYCSKHKKLKNKVIILIEC